MILIGLIHFSNFIILNFAYVINNSHISQTRYGIFINPLCPYQISLLLILLDMPPPSSLHDLFDQNSIVSFFHVSPEGYILISNR